MQYNRVLTIAGSDSGGGAGIQADIKTISACGCYAASAITAITVQNTLGVTAVSAVPTPIIEQQIEAVLSDIGADAIKIGMLHSSEVVEAVARQLDAFKIRNVVLDPVMVSTSGHKLIEDSAIDSLITILLPRARVITPNIPEAEILLGGEKLDCQSSLPDAARRLAEKAQTSVLLKAGHLTDIDRGTNDKRFLRMNRGIILPPDPIQKIQCFIIKYFCQVFCNESCIACSTKIQYHTHLPTIIIILIPPLSPDTTSLASLQR